MANDAIECIWMGDSIVQPDIGHRSNPVLGVDVVFSLDEGCRIAVQGPVTVRTVYPHRPAAEYVGVRFRPGIGSLRGDVGLTELSDESAPLETLGSYRLGRLVDELLEAPNLARRGAIVRRSLTTCRDQLPTVSGLVSAVLDEFGRAGPVRVAAVARQLGVTERHLQRTFLQRVGLTPKHAARLVRVGRLLEEISRQSQCPPERSGPLTASLDLASIAIAVGYFDQAHMTNDVGRVLGTTPRALLEEADREHRAQRYEANPSR